MEKQEHPEAKNWFNCLYHALDTNIFQSITALAIWSEFFQRETFLFQIERGMVPFIGDLEKI